MDCTAFFQDLVECAHCGADTYGVVWQNSGTINCDQCDEIIFDARDTSGTVVILELEESTEH
jgi:ribosomal protein S27E